MKLKIKKYLKKLKKALRKYRRYIWAFVAFIFAWLIFTYFNLPSCNELKTDNPRTTALIQERIEEAKDDGRAYVVRQTWIPIGSISPNVIRAVVAAEDFDFFSHSGFDYSEMRTAFYDAVSDFHLPRGASTITQQLAKNLYLSPSRSPIRKLKEAIITMRLESKLRKMRILELYLNVIEWGDGIFGVEAASQHYFNKSSRNLSESEAAFLAAIIPAPNTTFSPQTNAKRVANRRALLEKRMKNVKLPGD